MRYHALLAWAPVRDANPVLIDASFRTVIEARDHVYVMDRAAIVGFESPIDYENFVDDCKDTSASASANFVISPPLEGSGYRGWIRSSLWDRVRALVRG